jgi:hypothetical protein
MARIYDPTPQQETKWQEWVSSCPDVVRTVAERFDPWTLYLLKSTGQRVTVCSFWEDGTVSVIVSGDYNLVTFEREVFGIDPNDLEPCEIPSLDEPVGALLSDHEFEENIDALRCIGRPDLWVMGEDGKAKRKKAAMKND